MDEKQPQQIKVENPKLVGAMQTFKGALNRENEIKFLQEMLNARYLVPVVMETPPDASMQPGQQVTTRVAFQMLTNPKGDKFIPAFTDQAELQKQEPVQQKHQVAVLNVRDFAMVFQQNENCSGFVINPYGDNMCIARDQLLKILQSATQTAVPQPGATIAQQVDLAMHNLNREKEMEDIIRAAKASEAQAEAEKAEQSASVEAEAAVEETAPTTSENPQELIDALIRYMKKQKQIKRAYFQLLLGKEPHYLLAVECDEDQEPTFAAIKVEAGVYTDLPVVIMDVTAAEVNKLINSEKPFYEKKRFGLFG